MTMLKRLLKSLHSAVFDTSPDAGIAFFIRHRDGVSWCVENEMLVATVNGHSKSYALDQLTVGQLAGQLSIDGFEVAGLAPEFAGLMASVLIDGSGVTTQSNGDRLYAFRDLLRALLGGYARELRTAKLQVSEAIRQMVITQAEDEWLDLWGTLYNTPRPNGMPDDKYQTLIPEEAFRIRVNALAIEKAILDLVGQHVNIEEPWTDMFRLDASRLSSLNRFYDGDSIGYHIIRPVAYQPVVWDGVMDIIMRNKAAGVVVLDPEARHRVWVRDPLAGIILTQNWSVLAKLVRTANLPYLDNSLRLSDYDIDRNWLATGTSTYLLTNLPAQVSGIVKGSEKSHILGYGPAVYPDDIKIIPWHTGFFAPSSAEMYQQGKRTWKEAAVWKGEQSWRLPYSWRIFSHMTSYSSASYVPAKVKGSTIMSSSTGDDGSTG